MKKIILPMLVALFILTGCGSNSQTVKCSQSTSSFYGKMESNIVVTIKNSKFNNFVMEVNINLDDAYASQKSQFISQLESQYKSFEQQYGAKLSLKETDKGAKITVTMDGKQAEDFYGKDETKVTKKDVIDEFEGQGFSCK